MAERLTGKEDYEELSNEPAFSKLVKEWRAYRALGTVEELAELVEAKQDCTIKTVYDENGFPYLFEAEGTEAAHIVEILMAEADNRLVVLPCKVGDDIYWIDEENSVRVHKNGIKGIVIRNGEIAIEDTDGCIDVTGTKYCYLTREEAEKALEGQK